MMFSPLFITYVPATSEALKDLFSGLHSLLAYAIVNLKLQVAAVGRFCVNT